MHNSGASRRGIAESYLFSSLKSQSENKNYVVPAKPTGRANARPMTGSARAGTHNPKCLVAPSGGRSSVYNRHRWLWVPAFAGTTKVGEELFPHVVPDK